MNPHDTHHVAILWADLEHSLRAIGRDGGLVSPAVYDTSHYLRFNPPANPWPVVDWLLSQQYPDGGWLAPGLAKARYLPTLAALLAFKSLTHIRRPTQDAIEDGLAFLHQQQWADWATLDDLPPGAELILPRLLNAAQAADLAIDLRPYAALIDAGARQRSRLQRAERPPDQAALHVWEGWGTVLAESVVDTSGMVGQSPAASVVWLHAARSDPALADVRAQVRRGLLHAEAATSSPIPGVVGTRWPLTAQERIAGLHALLLAGMLGPTAAYGVPAGVRVAIDQQLSLLQDSVTATKTRNLDPGGLEYTAAARSLSILTTAGYPIAPKTVTQFEQMAVRHLAPWRDANARAPIGSAPILHALATLKRTAALDDYHSLLQARQLPSGVWPGEPEQQSSTITTAEVIAALLATGRREQIPELCQNLARFQHRSGAWGGEQGTTEETAHAVLALAAARRHHVAAPAIDDALERSRQWLMAKYHPFADGGDALWRGKEPYRPARIAHIVELTALLALLLSGSPRKG